jgi:hypothetical protein
MLKTNLVVKKTLRIAAELNWSKKPRDWGTIMNSKKCTETIPKHNILYPPVLSLSHSAPFHRWGLQSRFPSKWRQETIDHQSIHPRRRKERFSCGNEQEAQAGMAVFPKPMKPHDLIRFTGNVFMAANRVFRPEL